MDIVRPLVSSKDYVVQKYTKAHPFKAMGRVQAGSDRKPKNLLKTGERLL